MLKEVLSVETNDFAPDQSRIATLWLTDNGADVVRGYVSGQIAAEMVKEVNARYNIPDMPNQDQSIKEAQERIVELRTFLKVLDELRAIQILKKITITHNKL